MVLALAGGAAAQNNTSKFVWPPHMPPEIYIPFLPQIVIPINDQKVILVLSEIYIRGLNGQTCKAGGKIARKLLSCSNVTIDMNYKAGGKIFDLPIVGDSTISIATNMYINNPLYGKNLVNFNSLVIDWDGLNPGSDIHYTVNDLLNNLVYDFEMAACLTIKELVTPKSNYFGNKIVCDGRQDIPIITEVQNTVGEGVDTKNEEEMSRLFAKFQESYYNWEQKYESMDSFDKMNALGEIVQTGLQEFIRALLGLRSRPRFF